MGKQREESDNGTVGTRIICDVELFCNALPSRPLSSFPRRERRFLPSLWLLELSEYPDACSSTCASALFLPLETSIRKMKARFLRYWSRDRARREESRMEFWKVREISNLIKKKKKNRFWEMWDFDLASAAEFVSNF